MTRARPFTLAAVVLAAAFAAWLVTVSRMRGMDGGPGTNLGSLGWYVGIWVTMMAAMMLPSVLPMVLLYARVTSERARRGQAAVGTPVFLAGYFGVWTAFGLVAYGLWRAIGGLDLRFLHWDRGGPYIAAGAIAAAALYQLTPLKRVCLRQCRSPLAIVFSGWREGRLGALRMGAEHGAWCVGCCWGLMLALFAVGVMSITWMVIVSALIFAEKALPRGDLFSRPIGLLLLAFAVWIAVDPGSVPFLVQPGSGMPMDMQM